LEAARAVGEKPLSAGDRARRDAFLLPRRSVGLGRHIGKRIQAILRLQLDLIDGLDASTLALLADYAVPADASIGRRIEFGDSGFQRVRGRLLNIHLDRSREALWP